MTRRRQRRLAQLAGTLTLAAAIGACRGGREGTDTTAAIRDTLGVLADTTGAMVGRADSAARAAVREYSDAELLGFVNAANDGEVAMGRMVETKATDAQVRAFAQRTVREHTALKNDVAALATQLRATPTVPENDEDLVEDHRKAMADLNGRPRGREFDERYLEHEIAMHRKVVDEVEDALGRNPGADMRALLERARATLRAHLQAAQDLEKKFGV